MADKKPKRRLKPVGILLRPMAVVGRETLRTSIHKPVTIQYPWERLVIPDGYRGRPGLVMDKCIGCHMCAKICPTTCIEMVEVELPEKGKVERPQVNLGRCMMCGYCAEVCPKNAMIVTPEYELAEYSRQGMIYDPFRLQYEDRPGCHVDVIEATPDMIKQGLTGVNKKTGQMIRDYPEVNDAKCIGCSKCEKVCPADAAKMYEKGKTDKGKPIRRPKFDAEKCVGCEECLDNCPKDAITMKEVK
jgi:NADH-quinone oxidoreductase subunit I